MSMLCSLAFFLVLKQSAAFNPSWYGPCAARRHRPLTKLHNLASKIQGSASLDGPRILPALAEDASILQALKLDSKRGNWQNALRLLSQLEATPSGAPCKAYKKAILACRKKRRHMEAADVLARMGDAADKHDCNDVLTLLRSAHRYDAAKQLLAQMQARPQTAPDVNSYYQLLLICGNTGRWRDACELLAEMREALGDILVESRHYSAVLQAYIRDRRWEEALAFVGAIDSHMFEDDPRLTKKALIVCSAAGRPDLTASFVDLLGSKADPEDHAQCLIACRRAKCLESARAAWAALEASHCEPDELCFAVIVGTLFDAAATQKTPCAEASCVDDAMILVRQAVADLSPVYSPVVLQSALDCSIKYEISSAARESLRLLVAVDPSMLDIALQFQVLEVCAAAGDWDGVVSEAQLAKKRAFRASNDAAHLHQGMLDNILECTREECTVDAALIAQCVSEAFAELQTILAKSTPLPDASDVLDGHVNIGGSHDGSDDTLPQADATVDVQMKASRLTSQRRFSKTLALESESAEPLHVLYEDDDLLAVFKPIGVHVAPKHRFEAVDTMVNRVVAYLKGRTPFALHRLDVGTSGVLLMAKNLVAARHVTKQFSDRTTEKAYLAVLLGNPEKDSFECSTAIAEHPVDSKLSVVVPPEELVGIVNAVEDGDEVDYSNHTVLQRRDNNAKPARIAFTRFEVVARSKLATACSVRPVTGRHHQIRVHAESLGHPLAGDDQYGIDMQPKELLGARMLLHAHSLCVVHPTRNERVCFRAPVPEQFVENSERLGISAKDLESFTVPPE